MKRFLFFVTIVFLVVVILGGGLLTYQRFVNRRTSPQDYLLTPQFPQGSDCDDLRVLVTTDRSDYSLENFIAITVENKSEVPITFSYHPPITAFVHYPFFSVAERYNPQKQTWERFTANYGSGGEPISQDIEIKPHESRSDIVLAKLLKAPAGMFRIRFDFKYFVEGSSFECIAYSSSFGIHADGEGVIVDNSGKYPVDQIILDLTAVGERADVQRLAALVGGQIAWEVDPDENTNLVRVPSTTKEELDAIVKTLRQARDPVLEQVSPHYIGE